MRSTRCPFEHGASAIMSARVTFAITSIGLAMSAAHGQLSCPDPQWLPTDGGANATIYALACNKEGRVFAGGSFTGIGGITALRIAQWDGHEWSDLGGGVSSESTCCYISVFVIAALQNGEVIAGGTFERAGGIPVNSIARWDGASWNPMGSGLGKADNSVWAAAELPTGDVVVVGGQFAAIGGIAAANVARWDGGHWHPLGSGLNGEVRALAILPNGDLLAGGMFTHAGTLLVNSVARWDGAQWQAVDGGVTGGQWMPIHEMLVLPDGEVLVGGSFTKAGDIPVKGIARWNAFTGWAAMGDPDNVVVALARLSNGDIVSGGTLSGGGAWAATLIDRWNGSAWVAMGTPMNNYVAALAVRPNGELVAGGSFDWIGTQSQPKFARFGCADSCYADCDASGGLSIDDFVCFQTTFAVGSTSADCDDDGVLTIDDFVCFQTAFAIGC